MAGMPHVLKPLGPNGDHHQFSPNDIDTSSKEKVMRINKMITKRKCLDLLSNSLNTFFKKMYRDQFGKLILYVDIRTLRVKQTSDMEKMQF